MTLLFRNIFIFQLLSLLSTAVSDDNWKSIDKIQIPPYKTHLITLQRNNTDIEIKVIGKSGMLITQQNGPEHRNDHEFIVLSADQNEEIYELYVRAIHKTDFPPTWTVKVRELNKLNLIQAYTILHFASHVWHSSKIPKQFKFKILKSVLSTIPETNEAYSFAVNMKGWLCKRMENFSCAYQEGKKLSKAKTTDQLKLNGLWLMADANLNLGQIKEAIKMYSEVLKKHPKTKNTSDKLIIAEITGSLGLAQTLYSKTQSTTTNESYKNLKKAIIEATEIGDFVLASKIHGYLWSFHATRNEYAHAEASLEIAISLLQKAHAKEGLISLRHHRAMTYEMTGRLIKSLKTYRKNLVSLSHKKRPSTFANTLNNMAEIYTHLGDYQTAKKYYQDALNTYEEMSFNYGKAIAHRGLGKVESYLGKYELANEHFLISKNYLQNNNSDDLSIIHTELGKNFLKSNKLKKAKFHAKKAQSLQQKNTLNQNSYELTLLLANLAFLSNDKSYKTLISELDELYKDNEINKHLLLEKYKLKLEYSFKNSQFNEAHNLFNEAFLILQDIRQELDHNLAIDWQNRTNHLINTYIKVLFKRYNIKQDNIEQIHSFLESSKFIGLRERRKAHLLSKHEIEPEKSILLQRRWNRYLETERSIIKYQKPDNNDFRNSPLDQAQQEYFEIVDSLYSSKKIEKTQILNIKKIQNTMSDSEIIIRYHIDQQISFALVIWKSGKYIFNIPHENFLNINASRIIDQLKSPQNFDDLTAINDLSKILPLRILRDGNFSKIIIIPDGILHQFPFSLLNLSTDSNQYQPIIKEYETVKTHAISDYYASLKSERKLKKMHIAIIANPVFSDNNKIKTQSKDTLEFAPLPHTIVESQMIHNIFSDQKILSYVGSEATNKTLMSNLVRKANIVHIATHAFLIKNKRGHIGLATSVRNTEDKPEPGLLSIRELKSKPFFSDLIVLSGCETVLGPIIEGEGLDGLSRSLISQGANHVIGSLWPISDRATPFFMKEFYTAVNETNGNISAALTIAKRKFINDSKYRNFQHPFFWAGFELHSANRNPVWLGQIDQ